MASNHPHTLTGFITLSPLHQLAGVWWAFWRTMAAKFSWAFKMVSQFGSLGYTIMGKTADMTVVQKTPFTSRISHKHSLPKKLAVHRVLYPSMLSESWVEGKSVEEKVAQPSERTAALWGFSSKIDLRIWVNFTRNGLRLVSWHQEPPHTDVSRNLAIVIIRGVLPGLRRGRTGLLPSWFCWPAF